MEALTTHVLGLCDHPSIAVRSHLDGEVRVLVPQLTQWRTKKAVNIESVHTMYGGRDFTYAMATFALNATRPELRRRCLRNEASSYELRLPRVQVYHCVKFVLQQPDNALSITEDILHTSPGDKANLARFDPAIVRTSEGRSLLAPW
jgi:hypothetical protein